VDDRRAPARTRVLRVPPEKRGRRVVRLLLWLVGLVVFLPALAFGVGWLVFPTPSPDDLTTTQVATMAYSNGQTLATVQPPGVQNRVKVGLDQVPQTSRYAVLAAEDRSFYSNPGFDIGGIFRAGWSQITGGAGGGSTVTQQYIKNTTGRDQHTLWRKYREIIAAAKITKELSKDQILEDYLNTIYLGRGAYGIQAAAKAYFGENANQLTLSQGALLAAVIQSPSRWDPANNPDEARDRWNYVLDGMVAQGWLSPAERATASFPQTIPPQPPPGGIPRDYLGHIYTQVKAELAQLGIGEQQLSQDGLKITTTIDQTREKEAAAVAQRVMKQNAPNLHTALVSVDPRTGAIVAYYGGDNGVGLDYAQVLRQPGSSFKPFVMTAALLHNPPIGLGTVYQGTSPMTIAGQVVANSDGDSCDDCDLKTAMTNSINTVFYQLAVQVGPDAVAQAAHQAGIPDDLLVNPTAGIALGDKEVHPVDMASAYGTFADGGVYHKPHMISRVETASGAVLFDDGGDYPGQARFDPQVARNVTESMTDVASSSLIPLAGGRPVAAKTGTTQSNIPGQNKDAWTVGYTPSLSTAVWVGTDDNSPIKTPYGGPMYGRMAPGQIWQGYMNSALRGTPAEPFGTFDPIGTAPGQERDCRDAESDNGDDENANGDGDHRSDRCFDSNPDSDSHHRHRHHHDNREEDNSDNGGDDN
jgi:membrane peptidoglycan carboxypeptidase